MYIYIPFLNKLKEYDNVYGYYISIYSPEYVIEPKIKLNYNEKVDLMNLMNNGGWNKIIDTFKDECNNCFSENCIHKNRILPKCPPDYMKL